jgi:hypothetical protein
VLGVVDPVGRKEVHQAVIVDVDPDDAQGMLVVGRVGLTADAGRRGGVGELDLGGKRGGGGQDGTDADDRRAGGSFQGLHVLFLLSQRAWGCFLTFVERCSSYQPPGPAGRPIPGTGRAADPKNRDSVSPSPAAGISPN